MAEQNWRAFEKLAARIEKTLQPAGAIVRSPDRVRDLLTGSLREVDASIRYTLGTVPILITVECRRRDEIQDDTWIEQLATKREKIGAAKTIAVSLSGFSEPAKTTARLKGIELRTLREISDLEIANWLRSVLLTNVILFVTLKSMSAEFDSAEENSEVYRFEPEPPTGGIRTLIRAFDGEFVSPYEVWRVVAESNRAVFLRTPLDGQVVTFGLVATLPNRAIQVQTPNGPRFIKTMTFEVMCHHEIKKAPVGEPRVYEYADPGGAVVQRVEFKTEVEQIPITLGLQSAGGGTTINVNISEEPDNKSR